MFLENCLFNIRLLAFWLVGLDSGPLFDRFLLSFYQVSQLGAVVHKYQTAAQNASSGLSAQDLQTTCNS